MGKSVRRAGLLQTQTQSMAQQRAFYDIHVPVTAPPRRVVSLAPWVTLTLFELNVGNRLAGVTVPCLETVEAARTAHLRPVGAPASPDLDQVRALYPDLVVASADDTPDDTIEALQAAGLTVWRVGPRTVRDAINLMWDIMHAFNEARMTPRVRLIDQTFDHVVGASSTMEARRVFAPLSADPWRAFNRATYAHDLLQACGGGNVFADREARDFPVTQAEVIAAQPEVVLLSAGPGGFTPGDVAAFRALDIPAAREGKIHLIDGTLLAWPGTRLARALSVLPPLLTVTATPDV